LCHMDRIALLSHLLKAGCGGYKKNRRSGEAGFGLYCLIQPRSSMIAGGIIRRSRRVFLRVIR
jgi:hypothetical protein